VAEGDTIHRTAASLNDALAGQRLRAAAPHPRGRAAGVEQLDGRELEGVDAVGKHLLLRFGDRVLHSHLGMVGSWRLLRPGSAWPKPRASAWAVLGGEEWEAAEFRGPTLRVIEAGRLRRDPVLARLGPDILAADFEPADAVRRLREIPERSLGDALLEQTRVAGIGNIFKSESCFAARLDPWRSVGELADGELERALLFARELMRASLTSGRQPGAVYHRAGRPCRVCGTTIAARGQGDANRRTYWCPRCQRASSAQERGRSEPGC
jgi:endonuclease-8